MAIFGVPLLFLVLLELALRLAGTGYPTRFLLKSTHQGADTFVQNNRFGWRFFGPRAARLPFPISIPREKSPGTVRIFVFGESAAYGDPQPRFSLPRMLEATLELRHPGKKFEVVNAAMTGINSHVILPLARDCAQADGDVWVVYMGNNEVVGPYGAGTVFGKQTAPLPLIRAVFALKATRTGQLLDSLRGAGRRTAADSGEWEGLRAFIQYKVTQEDARMRAVYRNFERNLEDLVAVGKESGAKVVLSTVAVNLKDCAPFASVHRSGLSESQLREWQAFFDAGVKAQADGEIGTADAAFRKAVAIDGSFAELRFRLAQCALAQGNAVEARTEFAAARDLDALRFRCDSRLNEIIRRQATGDIRLADSELAMANASSNGLPGAELFYEHVHITFQGNYILARTIAEQVESALGISGPGPWPEIAQCAERLGYSVRDTQLALSEMLGRLADVPFTLQAGHDEQMRLLTEAMQSLPPANSGPALENAKSAVETALSRWPEDAMLWEMLGEIKQTGGDYPGAGQAAQRSLDILPSNAACWLLAGIVMAQREQYEEAMEAFRQVTKLDPQAVWARHNLGLCLEKLGRREEAVSEFKRALAAKPDYGTGWLALGQLYESMGRTNDANQCYDSALANPVNQADDLATLARFCFSRGWFDRAATNFTAAIQLNPSDPVLRLEAGRALVATGRHGEALQEYQAAVNLDPNQPQSHMQLGVQLGRLRKPDLAEQEFRKVLELDPDLTEARVNLGIALTQQEKLDEALKQFNEVLQRFPNEPNALRYSQLLRNRISNPAMNPP